MTITVPTRLEEAGLKAATLTDALPYIREYRGCSVVVKVGGDLLDDKHRASVLAQDLALLSYVGIRIVVVHGGGPQVTRAMKAAGLEPTFVSGLRVTEPHVMEAVRQVLVGSINPSFVALLREAGLNAFGLSGVDGGLIEAKLASGPNGEKLGQVGGVATTRGSIDATPPICSTPATHR